MPVLPAEDVAMILGPDGQAVEPAVLQQHLAQVNQQAAQIQSSAQGFKAAAGSGFHITPEAAATLINSCRHSLQLLSGMQHHLDTVSQSPPLGRTPVAGVVAPFTQQVATDAHGMRPAITSLQNTLTDMIQAYNKASTNYQETEAIITRSMQQQHATPPPPAPQHAQGSSPHGRNRAV